MKKSRPALKVVPVYSLMREKGTTVWHRPAPQGKPYCGVHLRDPEHLTVEQNHEWSPGEEFCERCDQLLDEDSGRRLAKVYALLIDMARRRRAEKGGTTREGNTAG